jgi:hypothetical protein
MSELATENADSFQTFENFDDSELAESEATETDWDQDEPEVKKAVKDEAIKALDDTDVDMDGDVVKEDGKKEPKKEVKKAKEESFDDEDEEAEEKEQLTTEKEEKLEEKKDNKKLRMRMGEELFNIDPDSTFKIKIDGEMTDVSTQELINNYAGKTAWDKKFTEIGKEKKALEFDKATVTKEKETLRNHLNEALGPIKDPSKNPIDSLLYLVEMSGEDPYAAYRRIMEANLDELSTLMDMGETERELYFHKKKDELHGNVAKKRQEKFGKEQAFNQAVQKVDSLRQTYNVTEDGFVDASEELESIYGDAGLDVNSITDEAIVDYASLKPHIVTIKELVAPYEENISEGKYGDVVAELSRHLRDGKLDKAAIQKILKHNFSVEDDVKELNTKVYQKGQKPTRVALKEESELSESFDDWN